VTGPTGVPETRYVDGGKGLIGYQVLGDGPIDLVYLTGATSHVDVRWDWPPAAAFLRRLASFSRLILFDWRGTGVSDRTAVDALPTWEEWTDDLLAVLDAVGSQRAAVFAVLDAGPMALLFAAARPERTQAVVLGNTGARFVAADDHPCGLPPEVAELALGFIETSWGSPEAAAAACPDTAHDAAFLAWLAKYMRASADPRATAVRVLSTTSVNSTVASTRSPSGVPREPVRNSCTASRTSSAPSL
jgi:pimeloyl-ACP methyl ester carboxylesterase